MLGVLAEEAMRYGHSINIDSIEVFLQRKILKRVEIANSIIKNVIEQERSGIAIRSIIKNHMSFVSTNVPEQIMGAIDLSVQHAKTVGQKVDQNFVDIKAITPVQRIRDPRLVDLALDNICNRMVEILSSIEKSKPVQKVDGNAAIELEERLIANTEGLWKREVGTRMKADILTSIKVGEFFGMGTGHLASRFLEEDWHQIFNSSIKSAYSQQGRNKISIDRLKGIILSPEAASQILAFALIPSFNNKNGQNGNEFFKHCHFNKKLQFIDDPTLQAAQNTFGFDDEGYPSKPKHIVSGGKCLRLLGMNFSCHNPHQIVISKGNCYRVTSMNLETRSYNYSPTISSSNFIVNIQRNSFDSLLSNAENGIFVKEIIGAQDANCFTGDFVVSVVEGYAIKNGEITNPILPCFISGNIYKILEESTLLLGNAAKENPISATPLNVIMPCLLSTNLTVSI